MQSLLAFLAMMVASLFALNQYRAQLKTYDDMVRGEYELMANAVAIEQMELIDIGTSWNNLDDLDADTTSQAFAVGSVSVDFQLVFGVQFVDEFGVPSGAPTNYKEVEIAASHSTYVLPMVTHTRIFTD